MSYEENVKFTYGMIQRSLELAGSGDNDNAIKLLDETLGRSLELDLQVEVLQMRATLKQDMGELQDAQNDLVTALGLSQEGTYGRYVIELGLGELMKNARRNDEAKSWFRIALQTCLKGDNISGVAALSSIIEICGGSSGLTVQDHTLCEEVVRKSWAVLKLPGVADISNLDTISELLLMEQGRGDKFQVRD